MSCTARSITTPTFDIRGGNGPTRVIAIERISSPASACLMAATAGIEALDMADHQRHAGAAGGGDDLAPLLDRGRDRLFDQDVDAAGDAGERDLVMQVRRRGDGHGIDAFGEQFVQAGEGAAAGQFGGAGTMLGQGIDDPDQRDVRQPGQNARMVGAHDACADDADPKRAFCVGFMPDADPLDTI